jgi:hypothetical protein
MQIWTLKWLDVALSAFHILWILFILVGWSWRPLLRFHLLALLLTGFSWFVLGLRYGIGYCPCTDWHWQIKRQLGHSDLPYSYIQFLLARAGLDLSAGTADIMTAVIFFAALALSLLRNFRGRRPGL